MRTKIDILMERKMALEGCLGDAQVLSVLNGLYRTAFERGEQHMAKVMREGGHVVYDHKRAQP